MATWQEIAGENLAAASELRQKGMNRSSISRAYYAAFSALLGFLGEVGTAAGRRTPGHRSLPRLIDRSLGRRKPKTARYLKSAVKRLYEHRLRADYDRTFEADSATVIDALRFAAAIIRTCEGM